MQLIKDLRLKMNFKYFSKNGDVLPIEQAVIPITNLEYSYGFGVYETLRVEKKKPFFVEEHIERLINSANIIKLAHPFNISQIIQSVNMLINSLAEETYNLKILLIGGAQPLLFIFPSAPYFPDKKLYKEGVCVSTYKYERFYPNAKTLNMFPSYLAYSEAKNASCYDALLVDKHGNILEGTRTNFFAIKGKTLYTVPKERVLGGVTRKMVIQVAQENGYQVIEQEIKLDEISNYDGAFLTSTSTKILPIRRINDFEYGLIVAEITKLIERFNNFIDTLVYI